MLSGSIKRFYDIQAVSLVDNTRKLSQFHLQAQQLFKSIISAQSKYCKPKIELDLIPCCMLIAARFISSSHCNLNVFKKV